MNYTLFDLFLNAYNGNSFAQLQIVQRFQPLLKKYAALLKYEDAYSDLQLYLLELLHSGKLTKLQRKDDGTLVKYIESSIRHQYISLNSRKNAVDNSVIASVDEIDFDQMSLSSNDEYPELLISDLHSVLQPSELTLLSQFVFKGMSIADIAEKSGVSRQAINRKKLSILKKLECASSSACFTFLRPSTETCVIQFPLNYFSVLFLGYFKEPFCRLCCTVATIQHTF